MDPIREAALSRLPAVHALAVRLRDAGVSEALIVRRLEIEPESLGPLMSIAEAKLAAALAATTPAGGRAAPLFQRPPSPILTGNFPTPLERS